MSSLSTLPKGDSAWLLRKAIERIIQQISVLETNIGSSTTGNSSNTQIIFNDAGTLRGDAGLTYNKTTDLLSVGAATITGALTAGGNVGFGTTNLTSVAGYNSLKINNATNGAIIDLAQGDAYKGRLVATASDFAFQTAGTIPIIMQVGGNNSYRIDPLGIFTWYDGAGGTRMTLNSTGLGVGVTPSYKLDIAGVGNFDQLRVSAAAATNVALVNTTSGLTYTVYSANTASNGFNGFGIFDGSNYVLRIDSSGNTTLASATITGNTTLGDAQTDTATINGQLTARQGEFPSAVRAAASDYAAVTFDGATSGTRIISALTGQNIGTGDMSMWNRFRVFTTTGTTRYIAALSSSSTTADQASACILYINSIGGLVFYLYGATVSDFRYATISGFQTAYSGQVVDIVVTRTGATLKIYINGIDTAYSETTGGTPPAWSATITSTNLFIGQSTGTSNIFTGRIYRSVVFNRALSAADVTELITIGVNPADQWGTQTAVLTSDFSAGVDSFLGLGGAGNSTLAGNIDGIGGQNDNLRVTTGTFVSNIAGAYRLVLNRAKRFLVTYSYYIPSTNVTLRGVRTSFFNNGTAGEGPAGNTTLDAWTTVSELSPPDVANAGSNNGLSFHATNLSGAVNYTGTSGDVMYLRAITLTRIGAIVDLDFTVGAGYQATDRSTNALHGTLFNGVEFTQPKRVAVLYATTNTATNQHVFGTLAIPTNAIIEDIIVNSTGTATVTVRDAAAGNVIVNAASVVAGRQKLTIAQPFSSGGQLWVQSSTTATLQFTILYTIAA